MIALTHIPSPNLHAGERTFIGVEAIDHAAAARQHAQYCETLAGLGWDVRVLSHHLDRADATFIEDTAVVLDEVAILASMGAPSRREEPLAIEPLLRQWREVRRIESPGILEGGDILRIGRSLFVGHSQRTNRAGIEQLEHLVNPFGYRLVVVEVTGCLHLKTAVCALPDGRLLINPAWINNRDLRDFQCIAVPEPEPFAANLLLSGQTIVLPAAQTQTADLLSRDFPLAPVPLSEFAKAEGGVTCLSLLIK